MILDKEREENTSNWINKQHGGKEGEQNRYTYIFNSLTVLTLHITNNKNICLWLLLLFGIQIHFSSRNPVTVPIFSLPLSLDFDFEHVCVCVCASARVSSNCFAPMEFNGTQTRRSKRNNCNGKRVLRWRFRIFSEWKAVVFANRYCNIEFNTTYLPYLPLNHYMQLKITLNSYKSMSNLS